MYYLNCGYCADVKLSCITLGVLHQ